MTYITVRTERDLDFYDLLDVCWSGALQTLKDVEDAGKEEELMDLLAEVFPEYVNDTALNDYLWFEDTAIYEALGIDPYGEHEDDEEGEDDND